MRLRPEILLVALVAVFAVAALLPGAHAAPGNLGRPYVIMCQDFDNNVTDQASGVSYTNTCTFTNSSKIGSHALTCSGSSQQLVSASTTAYLQYLNGDQTICYWFKSGSTAQTQKYLYHTRVGASTNNIYPSSLYEYANDVIESFGNWILAGVNLRYTVASSVDTNWHFNCIVYDDAGTMLLYTDGVNFANHSTGTTTRSYTGANSMTFTIGSAQGSNYINGAFDTFFLSNKSLSAAEVSDLYNSGSGRNCSYVLTTPTDSCTYSGSGNWDVLGSDNCVITANTNVLGNNLTCSGAGTLTVQANVTNFSKARANMCKIKAVQGGRLRAR